MLEGCDKHLPITLDVDDKITALAEEDTPINRIALIARTTKNMIGEFSNYASVYLNRKPTTPEQIKKYDDFLSIISVTVGKSIDYAKTGVLYPMPRIISKWGRPLPYFMRYRSPYYARQELSKAQSNMNRLCWELEKKEREIKWPRLTQYFDYHLMYNDDVAFTTEEFEAVEKLFLDFCQESNETQRYQNYVRQYRDPAIRQKFSKYEAVTYMADWDGLYRKYKKLCMDAVPNQQKLANIAVLLTFVKYRTKGRKFAWIVAPDGLLANIKPKQGMMIPMRDETGNKLYLGKRYRMVPMNTDEIDIDMDLTIDDLLEDL